MISIVCPLLDEEGSLEELHARFTEVLGRAGEPYEIIFINDGSSDGSADIINALQERDKHVGVVHLRRNFGKAAALDAGFRHARGDVVVTIDADLQDDPGQIPLLLEKLDQGYDVVSGWKQVRNDPLGKRLPSRLFNLVIARLSGLSLHDFNCGLKAYRRESLANLNLYGELHRYISALLHWQGFRIAEVPVEHHARRHGQTKYGATRLVKGLFDVFTVLLNTRYRARPLHLFGFMGGLLSLLGFSILSFLTVLWFMGVPIGGRPLLFLGIILMLMGVQLGGIGLLGELITRSQASDTMYYVREERPPQTALDE